MFLKYRFLGYRKANLRFAVILCLFGFIAPVSADIIFEDDFQLGYIDKYPENRKGWVSHACEVGPQGSSLQNEISRDGNYALRSYLEKDNPSCPDKNFRTEIAGYKNQLLDYEKTYWIGFSLFIPNDWVIEQDQWSMEYIFQLHSNPSPTSPNRDSVLSLRISQSNMKLVTHYDNKKKYNNWVHSINDMKGKWTDFVFKIKPSQFVGSASLELWMNPDVNTQPVFSKTSMSLGSPGDIDLYVKLGLYKPELYKKATNIKSHTIYHDQLRIGDVNSSLAEVSPRGAVIVNSVPTKPFTATVTVIRPSTGL